MTPYKIVAHHHGILVVEKPFGLASQATQKKKEENLFALLQKRFSYVALHHRLDQTASGLMLFSTDARLNKALTHSFQNHLIARKYWAWVLGETPMAGEWKEKIDGKKALTIFSRKDHQDDISLLDIELRTGRTHQIRKHAKQAGFPLLGDHRYGGFAAKLWPRLALHAHSLAFTHPTTKEWLEFSSPIPADLNDIL